MSAEPLWGVGTSRTAQATVVHANTYIRLAHTLVWGRPIGEWTVYLVIASQDGEAVVREPSRAQQLLVPVDNLDSRG
jgi:hypothetical protein